VCQRTGHQRQVGTVQHRGERRQRNSAACPSRCKLPPAGALRQEGDDGGAPGRP
jgi:hypothetical protein